MASGAQMRRKGSLVDGSAPKKVAAAVEQMGEDVGQLVHNAVKLRLGQVLANPTGYYESRVVTDVSAGSVEISDSGVIYGPWLEGTGSRNASSRFKGYATFRKVAQDMEKKAVAEGERVLGRKLASL